MHQIRPLDIPRGHALEVFSELVDRFGRENGVAATFRGDASVPPLPTRTARELGRTLQEALRNVRKHAHARRVDVRFTAEPTHWKLIVTNDGQPFSFTGRMTLRELELTHRGPRVIKERVRDIGGDLAIESAPGRGVTLEITVPRSPHLYATA
jgi:signal transduction histidine kinase